MEAIKDKKGLTIEIKLSWCIEDVMERAKQRSIKLSRKEAALVLETCLHRHDCNLGITWDTLDVWTDDVLSER